MNLHTSKSVGFFLKLSFAFILISGFAAVTVAQSNMTVITAEQAASEVNAQQAAYGFSQIYFSNSDINRLTNVEGANAVRFYTSYSPGSSNQGVIAVAIHSDGSETGPYLQSDGLSATEINQESAQAYVQSSKESGYTTVALTIDNGDMTGSIMNPNGTGIHIKPGLSESTNTMIGTAATSDGSYSQDLGTDNLRGEAPCPNNCGDGFLVNLNE